MRFLWFLLSTFLKLSFCINNTFCINNVLDIYASKFLIPTIVLLSKIILSNVFDNWALNVDDSLFRHNSNLFSMKFLRVKKKIKIFFFVLHTTMMTFSKEDMHNHNWNPFLKIGTIYCEHFRLIIIIHILLHSCPFHRSGLEWVKGPLCTNLRLHYHP